MGISISNDLEVMTVQVPTGPQVLTISVPGVQGPAGPAGPQTSWTIGTVATGAAGSSASATVTGTAPNYVLNLTIPRGDPGSSGAAANGLPAGGTAGQILQKIDGTDYNASWAAPIWVPAFADPDADRLMGWDDSAGAWVPVQASTGLTWSSSNVLTVRAGSETQTGILELATAAETTTGTSTALAVHPAGLKVELDKKANATHTHGVTDLTATGTKDATTFLRGDNTWAVPAGGGSTPDATTTSKGIVQLAGHLGGTAAAPTVTSGAGHTHTASQISDSTATGRSVVTATDAAAARTAIGAGTSSLAIGTTSTTAKAGDYQPTAANISDSTATGRSVLTAANAAAARTAIGAGQVDSSDSTVLNVIKITQAAYDALGTKVATTLYVIVG